MAVFGPDEPDEAPSRAGLMFLLRSMQLQCCCDVGWSLFVCWTTIDGKVEDDNVFLLVSIEEQWDDDDFDVDVDDDDNEEEDEDFADNNNKEDVRDE